MTICVAEVAATGADLRSSEALAAIGDRFLEWYRGNPRGIGLTTRAVLSAARIGADLTAAARAYHARTGRSASNGALMRTAPVALAHLGNDQQLVEAATAVASLTHADPLAGQSCAIWCIAIDRAIREDRLNGAWEAMDLLPESSRDGWTKSIGEAVHHPPTVFVDNWHTVQCLQTALSAVVHTPGGELEDSLQLAVGAGGDTDTVAAVAGALLGARWGPEAVPHHWRSCLRGESGRTAESLVQLGRRIIEGQPTQSN